MWPEKETLFLTVESRMSSHGEIEGYRENKDSQIHFKRGMKFVMAYSAY